jgi:phosphoglycolate phosphatase
VTRFDPVPRFDVACLDMAGTTVRDDNTVMEAFAAAVSSQTLPAREFNAAMQYARDTMGQSKIEVFRHIFGDIAASGSSGRPGAGEAAQAANAAFEEHYAGAVAKGEISPMPGAEELFAACRSAGVKVCLSTGFSPLTRDAIIAALGWRPLVDLLLSPADAGRGRPWADMPLTALLRLGGGSVSSLAVVGDTPADIESGLRAGAGLVAGVLSGDSQRAVLEAVPGATGLAGTPVILDSVAGLLPHLVG